MKLLLLLLVPFSFARSVDLYPELVPIIKRGNLQELINHASIFARIKPRYIEEEKNLSDYPPQGLDHAIKTIEDYLECYKWRPESNKFRKLKYLQRLVLRAFWEEKGLINTTAYCSDEPLEVLVIRNSLIYGSLEMLIPFSDYFTAYSELYCKNIEFRSQVIQMVPFVAKYQKTEVYIQGPPYFDRSFAYVSKKLDEIYKNNTDNEIKKELFINLIKLRREFKFCFARRSLSLTNLNALKKILYIVFKDVNSKEIWPLYPLNWTTLEKTGEMRELYYFYTKEPSKILEGLKHLSSLESFENLVKFTNDQKISNSFLDLNWELSPASSTVVEQLLSTIPTHLEVYIEAEKRFRKVEEVESDADAQVKATLTLTNVSLAFNKDWKWTYATDFIDANYSTKYVNDNQIFAVYLPNDGIKGWSVRIRSPFPFELSEDCKKDVKYYYLVKVVYDKDNCGDES